MPNIEVEDYLAYFPLERVVFDEKLLEQRWNRLVEEHPEFGTPCFKCQFFFECNAGAKRDPVTCEFLFEWFVSCNGKVEVRKKRVSKTLKRRRV
ncbi:hypothetical protein B9Q02_08450 [Candidatus Marsarchaeota G1 archaeon BE_D]|uniref:Uncharacterized protein n=1 Tax=Candidatus Marsarchaeota G1 archaeon BE_D TaxID=1978156 RepID=A0A2R6AES3_9ARCH|nr:MAG: hypothetical protein B9Q02_08450 [Candidatus Marsarchaeota G1 archaeon BE_D]